MATSLLRPNADAKADWTESPIGAAFAVLADVVIQPTAPLTALEFITSATNGQICRVDCETITLAPGEAVLSAKAWAYLTTPAGRTLDLGLIGGPTNPGSTVPAGTAASWQSVTLSGNLTQTQLNALQIQFLNGTGTGTTTVYAAYIELITQIVTGGLSLRGVG